MRAIRRSTVPTAVLATGLLLGAAACEGAGEGEAEIEDVGGGEGELEVED